MSLSPKTIRTQMNLLRPLMDACSLETVRKAQDKIGELMEARFRKQVIAKEHAFSDFTGAWMLPHDERRQGVILYLHGGGYTCGSLHYAKGFGSMLAGRYGVRVFCAAYRLAPEHPFPAALEDALESYRYLLGKGYSGKNITLCGESAGGGLCYCLCLKLKELGLELPGSIIAISPWTDLTASGSSYEANKTVDPSMTSKVLDFYAGSYTDDRTNPLASPLFGDLRGMPPSLLFVGGDEIMRSDTEDLHNKLRSCGCESSLTVASERWHGYLLYGLQEDEEDFSAINRFLNRHLSQENKLRWLPLDNAAKIYPAARRHNWSSLYRFSATMSEPVDVEILQSALDVTVRRFPSIAARLRKGLFWYYLQQIPHAPRIQQDNSYPMAKMSRGDIRSCGFRVLVYNKRIAVEFFHSLTDGSGALVFLKSLLAEYLQQRYGLQIPAEKGVLGRLEEPTEAELEDSFQKYSGNVNASRRESDAWRMRGTPEPNGFLHVTCMEIPVRAVLEKAHAYNASLTAFLCACLMRALMDLQNAWVPDRRRHKPIKVLVPVNLRRVFPSKTLRNFSLYSIPEADPRLGDYDIQALCNIIRHRMGLDVTPQQMSAKIATNVSSERILAVKLMPLFIKNIVMKAVFDAVGERKSCLSISNLGQVQLPEVMEPYVERMDVILGVQSTKPNNCGVLSYRDKLYVNFIRNIKEPDLEYAFYRVLRDLGIPVTVESNQPQE